MTPEGQLFEKLAVLSTFDRTTAARTDVVNLWLVSWWVPFRVLYSRNEWHAICSAVAFQYEHLSDILCWNWWCGYHWEKEKVLFHRKRLKVRRSFRNVSQMPRTLKKITCLSNKKICTLVAHNKVMFVVFSLSFLFYNCATFIDFYICNFFKYVISLFYIQVISC